MANKTLETLPEATILFAGDSGDGMQLTGSQFTLATAYAMNDLATLPDFPAEIRAPAGTTYGVSGFQLHFGSVDIRTPGDEVDLLVAMNPAALKVNLDRVRLGGTILVNSNAFDQRSLDLAHFDANPLDDTTLDKYHVIQVELTRLTRETLKDSSLNQKEIDRSKNMFALGLALWLYSRPLKPAEKWIARKFAKKQDILDANLELLRKGFYFGETTELFVTRYEVTPATLPPGRYRAIQGVHALAMGLVAAAKRSGLKVFYGSYPITPASDILHALSRFKNHGIMTVQAEDEIAAVGMAIGASFGGCLGITGTSGPGVALKTEAMGLAHITELPLVVINVQRGGPSTGLPTKTEQSDLMQAMYGRNGDAPLPIIAASTPGDCFQAAYEACRMAVKYMTPVILLSDGYLANGSEPWLIPSVDDLPEFDVEFAGKPNAEIEGEPTFHPYKRNAETLARPWARPGTPGLEHRVGGLEKADVTGNVSYDPANHEHMTRIRAEKVARIQKEMAPLDIFGADEGDVLIVGWGSTRGAIEAAVSRVRESGHAVGSIHLRWVNPLPPDLSDIFARYRSFLVPELNNGQLVRMLRAEFLLPFEALNKIQGRPFGPSEIQQHVMGMING
ncbi:MAG: 2-oxoglutarate ferredoxin oxidoreductase subunit alpha [Bacteroidetes bacterium CG12_big_fil_rev_8_21_14_0_65_60_17]|nr:MAG: 2-oxoglutarate ferredoxin oxidoreductase subunit alpha [Bacteroidetes bacterium CG12_big_fil_rev_8_21_14_0_65_60_17]